MITQAEIILPKYQHELKMAVTLPRWEIKKRKGIQPTDITIVFVNLRESDTTVQ
jgi:hypothetical protein